MHSESALTLERTAMQITTRCPHCSVAYKLPSEHIGRQAKCRCGQIFVISDALHRPSPAILSQAVHVGDMRHARGRNAFCPGCGLMLPSDAAICIKCGYDLRIGSCHTTVHEESDALYALAPDGSDSREAGVSSHRGTSLRNELETDVMASAYETTIIHGKTTRYELIRTSSSTILLTVQKYSRGKAVGKCDCIDANRLRIVKIDYGDSVSRDIYLRIRNALLIMFVPYIAVPLFLLGILQLNRKMPSACFKAMQLEKSADIHVFIFDREEDLRGFGRFLRKSGVFHIEY